VPRQGGELGYPHQHSPKWHSSDVPSVSGRSVSGRAQPSLQNGPQLGGHRRLGNAAVVPAVPEVRDVAPMGPDLGDGLGEDARGARMEPPGNTSGGPGDLAVAEVGELEGCPPCVDLNELEDLLEDDGEDRWGSGRVSWIRVAHLRRFASR
jgi:hypothetical protein